MSPDLRSQPEGEPNSIEAGVSGDELKTLLKQVAKETHVANRRFSYFSAITEPTPTTTMRRQYEAMHLSNLTTLVEQFLATHILGAHQGDLLRAEAQQATEACRASLRAKAIRRFITLTKKLRGPVQRLLSAAATPLKSYRPGISDTFPTC